jgi:hypothetical protein
MLTVLLEENRVEVASDHLAHQPELLLQEQFHVETATASLVLIKLVLPVIAQMEVQLRIRAKEHFVEFELLLRDRIQDISILIIPVQKLTIMLHVIRVQKFNQEPEVVVLRVRCDYELERLKQRLYPSVFLLFLVEVQAFRT